METTFMRYKQYGKGRGRKKSIFRPVRFLEIPQKEKSANTKKEVDTMLLSLGLSGSVRTRKDGLIEMRVWIDGKRTSFYGHTYDELLLKFKKNQKEKKEKEKNRCPRLLDWIKYWIAQYKVPILAENSIKALKYCCGKQIAQNFENKQINRISAAEIEKNLLKIESTRMRKYTRGMLVDAFRKAAEIGLIKKNPAEHLSQVKHRAQRGKALTPEEQKSFIQKIAGTLHGDYFLFLLYSGCRRAEGCALRWEHVDFCGGWITIPGTKTEGSRRIIPMFRTLREILERRRHGEKSGKIFGISEHQASIIFKNTMPDHHLHEIRHTCATNWLDSGVDIKTVQAWLGHSNIQTTANIYAHTTKKQMQDAAAIVDKNTPLLPP